MTTATWCCDDSAQADCIGRWPPPAVAARRHAAGRSCVHAGVSGWRRHAPAGAESRLLATGYPRGRQYSPIVISKLYGAVAALRVAYVYAQRVDWLLSDDDGEESFLKHLEEELKEAGA